MSVETLQLPIIGQKIIAEKTCEVSFDLSEKEFNFLAGQYIRVIISKLLYADSKGSSRLFSIVSSPNDKDKISIAFRDSGSGFKRTLMELSLGSLVEIEGPFGYFTLPQNSYKPIVFLAGGIGITPCLSMIRFATENKLTYSIILLYVNKNQENAAYFEELTAITRQNPRFLLKNQFGRINKDYIREAVKDLSNSMWYIVGPPAMVADMRNILSSLGVNYQKIYFEDFAGY